jgi:hypothetical protein
MSLAARGTSQPATQEAEEARAAGLRAWCAQVIARLATLTPEGRQRVLRALVESVVVRDGVLELRGVLPGNCLPDQDQTDSSEPARYTLVVAVP